MSTGYTQPYCDKEDKGLDKTTDEQLLNTARERGTTAFHINGTVDMGPQHD